MAVAYGAVTPLGLLSQQYPPPLLPKPGKDNVRLQKLLKRTAKKKASAQASQPAALFRSSLSPVNEASPDLEHSDHSTPPRTPETPFSLYTVQGPPRFTARPLYQHVASPYPQRAAYGRGGRFSPQTVQSYSYTQQVTAVYSAAPASPGPVPQPAPVPAAEVKKPVFSAPETHVEPRPAAASVGTPQPKTTRLGPTPYQDPGVQAFKRPLTVLTPLKSKSPRPTFKATEPSRSPKPMFDVPQIRMYTASTSYYETSRTPPVYDSAGLTSIGSTVTQSRTTDTKQELTPSSEVRRGATPTAQLPVPGTDSQRRTPTLEAKRGATPTAEATTITSPATETKRATPTSEVKRATPTSEVKRATPTTEIRVKTPTTEFQTSRTTAGRSKSSPYHMTRAATPVFEISRPNPLLFAVSSITVESERSRSPRSVSGATPEPKPTETILNGDLTPATEPVPETINLKSEPDLTQTVPVASQTIQPPTPETTTPAVTSYGYQRPRTPTYEASRLMTTSTGYKRPKTPTYGSSPSGVSPVAFQRPKTPTQVAQKSKSSYRGLTPAEYAAYGGIKTYTPAFGLATTKTEEEVQAAKEDAVESKPQSQDPPVKVQTTAEVSQVKETTKIVQNLRDEQVAVVPKVPIIIVSQASDTSGAMAPQETSTVSSQGAVTQDTTVVQEAPKVKPPTTPEKQKEETPVQEVEPEIKTPEAKGGDQDPLKAVRKLLGKDKVQKDQKEPVKPGAATKTKSEDESKGSSSTGSEEKVKESAGDASLPPAAEPLLKVVQKPKGMKSKPSGWSRLKKHMVVEQEEPKFPDAAPVQKEAPGPDQSAARQAEESSGDRKAGAPEDENQSKDAPKATKMWDAVLFQMFSTKENIMHQIELNKSEEQKQEEEKTTEEQKEIPSFAFRLPVLLFSPKFDAKKLKEAASRPVTKISTVFEMGLIGRKGKEEEPKDFNRTARGFAAT